jgi:hypothetical protein
MRTRIFAVVFGLLLAGVFTSAPALAGPFSGAKGTGGGSGPKAIGGGGGGYSRHYGGHPRHPHHHTSIAVGFGFGYPFWGPWYYPPPYYYPVAFPVQPVTYIERVAERQRPPAAEPGAWWYYCGSSQGYYPHVKACPTGWQRVPPTPPN